MDQLKESGGKGNLNTILISIVIAVLLAVGKMTFTTNVKLAEVAALQVSRGEIEAKIQAVRVDVMTIQADIAHVKLEIVSLQIQSRQPPGPKNE